MTQKAKQDIKRKLKIFAHAAKIGNIRKTCRYFGIARTNYYKWRDKYDKEGEIGLINNKPCPVNYRLRMQALIEP